MKNSETITKKDKANKPEAKLDKGIENHKKAATHLQAAAKNHLKAAKEHKGGDHKKAAQSTVVAQGHVNIAAKAQKADSKQHATKG